MKAAADGDQEVAGRGRRAAPLGEGETAESEVWRASKLGESPFPCRDREREILSINAPDDMSDPKEHSDNRWKEKYLALADADAANRAEQAEREQLLSRAVTRLAIAAAGLDPVLDPHLKAIRETVRKDLQTAQLRQELDALTESLIRIPASGAPEDTLASARELMVFMQSQYPSPAHRALVESLRQRIEEGQFGTRDQLFAAVAKLLGAIHEPGERSRRNRLGRWFAGSKRGSDAASNAGARKHLEGLLRGLEVPNRFEKRKTQLLVKVGHGDADLPVLLDETSSLIEESSTELRKEQSELSGFLAGLGSKLEEVEGQILGLNALNDQSAENRRNSDRVLGSELVNMRASASEATDLAQLKESLSHRVDVFASHLQAYRDAEEARHLDSQRQLREATLQMRTLEQAADDLRLKLESAREFAYVDPVTQLPNRQAYLQRASLEEKRWSRFRQAVSLLLWEIDDFTRVSERFGLAAGEKALSFIGRILAGAIEGTDFVGRHGGEKFVMLLVGTDELSALEVARELCGRIASCEFTASGKPVEITVSCGISEFKGRDNAADVFERAEMALYQARRKGGKGCELAVGNR